MGIGLKDFMKEDKNSLVADKQKKTIKGLIFLIIILVVIAIIIGFVIISNNSKVKREERVNLIARDVANISNVIKGIGRQYVSNSYDKELAGMPLDDNPIEIDENGVVVEYRYGYYYVTPEEMATIITSLNLPNEKYIINYISGEVINCDGVKASDGKKYYKMDDIIATADGQKPKAIIYIHNAEEMKYLQTYPYANFVLSNNIDMSEYASGEGWSPVGEFSGEFDGRNYTISNLIVNRPTTMYSGLFGEIVSSAKVGNVVFENANIRGGDYTGVLAGLCSTNITNVKINNSQVNSQSQNVGSLVGAFDKGTIEDCSANDVIVNADSSVGGLVGSLYGGTLKRSSANVQVTGIDRVGGLIGEIKPNEKTIVTEVFANASITGNNNVGGFAGSIRIISNSILSINNSYSEGVIVGGKQVVNQIELHSLYTATDIPSEAQIRGGFVGKSDIENTSTNINRCCFEKDPLLDIGVQYVGKQEGELFVVNSNTPAEMMNRVTYSDWDFDLWKLDEGISRPHLRWEFENYEPKQIIEEK